MCMPNRVRFPPSGIDPMEGEPKLNMSYKAAPVKTRRRSRRQLVTLKERGYKPNPTFEAVAESE